MKGRNLTFCWRVCALALAGLSACGHATTTTDGTGDDVPGDDAVAIPDDATADSGSADATPTSDVTTSIGLWTPITVPGDPNVSLHGVWSDGSTRVVAAGTNGTVVTWDGLAWKVATSGKFATLNAVAGSANADIAYAVGMAGTVVQSAGKDGTVGTVWAPPGGCLAPADCDDGDICTTDICDSGVCQHSSSGASGCCGGIDFADSFDGGLGKWTVTDSYASSSSAGGIVWKSAGVYGIDGILRAASPPAAAYFGRTDVPCADDASKFCATYDNGKTVGSVMTSQEFAISAAKSAILTFQLFLDVQSGFYDSVQISVIPSGGGSKKVIADKQSIWPTGSTNGKFVAQTLDLTEYVGQKIKLEIRFDSYSNTDNSGQGVFIDDLLVSTTCASGSTAGKGLTDRTLFGAWAFSATDAYAVGDGGVIGHWDGNAWGLQAGAMTGELDGMAGASGVGIVAVGDQGVVGTVTATGVAPIVLPTQSHLAAVAVDLVGNAQFNACAVGAGGVTLDGSSATGWKLGPTASADLTGVTANGAGGWVATSSDGTIFERLKGAKTWTSVSSNGVGLHGVTHTASGQVIAVGDYGTVTQRTTSSSGWNMSIGDWTSTNLWGVYALSDTDIWTVGEAGMAGHFKDGTWTAMTTPTPANLRAVWAASPTVVFAVGLQGAIVRWDGKVWKKMLSPSVKDWYAVWGNGPDDVYAVGAGGQIAHWDGQDTVKWSWKAVGTHIDGSMRAVWGLTPDDVWMVGELGLIYHNDGTGWTQTPIPDYQPDETAKPYKIKTTLLAIWGATWDNVWAVGEPDSKGKGVLVHWDGSAWGYDPSFADEGRTVRAMWGWSQDKILMAGTQGMVLRFDGQGHFQELHPGTIATLFGITGYGKDALLVGDIGTVLRWTPLD